MNDELRPRLQALLAELYGKESVTGDAAYDEAYEAGVEHAADLLGELLNETG